MFASTSVESERAPERYEFLDGLRGLAALVVLFHHVAPPGDGVPAPAPIRLLFRVLGYGHYAVAVFIVLSGFCLMLPVAGSAEDRLKGGVLAYLGRRARRILPPYYAAIALFLVVIWAFPGMNLRRGESWDIALPVFDGPGAIVSHLLLLHNFNPEWIYRVDPPMWSVATEWQIYFIFPMLLVLRRRMGLAAAVLCAVAAGYAATLALLKIPGYENLEACPWYLGLFAFGMVAAVLARSREPRLRATFERIPWGFALVATALCAAAAHRYAIPPARSLVARVLNCPTPPVRMFMDVFAGLATATLILACVRVASRSSRGWDWARAVRNSLESRPAMFLGSISYSLYLVHYPLLAGLRLILEGQWSARTVWLAEVILAAPLTLAAAYLFHIIAERPFMKTARTTTRVAAVPRPHFERARRASRPGIEGTPTRQTS